MNNNYNNDDWNTPFNPNEMATDPQTSFTDVIERDKNSILSSVFGWMASGLGLSAITALGAYHFLGQYMGIAYIPLIIIELILVLVFSFRINNMSATTAKICFIVYSIVNGLTLSAIFFTYQISSIYTTFFITASMFAVAAIYGKVTKKDLSGIGTYLVMGLWGIIIAGIVNIFLQNSMLDFIVSLVGVVIFVGLTAYDVNKIRNISMDTGDLEEKKLKQKLIIWFALQLYLDFINLFLKLLRLFGKRK